MGSKCVAMPVVIALPALAAGPALMAVFIAAAIPPANGFADSI